MQCRNNKVSGNGSLNGDAGCFSVSDFSDHYDIRILTENGTQGIGKGQVCLDIYLHLVYTVHIGFHRIFYGDNINLFTVQFAQNSITGR